MAIKTTFGEYFKAKRIEKGFTLREFCKKYGLDPGNISKLERGLLPPPASREKLEEYATFLGLKKGSDEWLEFFDRAAASRGELPKDFLDDDEVLKALPIIFRTIRGKKVSREMLNELIDKIRRT
ncbi:MAG: helix-turn-helix transcriptional regulator [Candidatus Aminicenantes bacterium]|nr:helix-turn-helix transcriptional regulator [Candidatus Aminicenantes bacterium]